MFLHGLQQSIAIFTTGCPFPFNTAPSHGDLDPHRRHNPLGPSKPTTQTASGLVQPFLQGSRLSQTDRPRYSVGNNRPHLCTNYPRLGQATKRFPGDPAQRGVTLKRDRRELGALTMIAVNHRLYLVFIYQLTLKLRHAAVPARVPIDQPFSRESSPNPNLASDQAPQQVCDHWRSVTSCCLSL